MDCFDIFIKVSVYRLLVHLRHNHLVTTAIILSTFLDHSRCSKWRPFALTHACSRVCHWALSIMPWGIRSQVSMLQLVNAMF